MVTDVVAVELVQPLVVALTEYVPEAAVGTLAMFGFCKAEVKLLGPLHE